MSSLDHRGEFLGAVDRFILFGLMAPSPDRAA